MRRSVVVFASVLLSACGGEVAAPLVAADIVINAPLPGRHMSAGYISFTNNTDVEINISRVDSPQFASVEIHESVLEDGVAKMRRIDVLAIAAQSSVTLEPGGKHLMLMRPDETHGSVSLNFYSGNTLLLSVNAPTTEVMP